METGTLKELGVKPGDVIRGTYYGSDKTYTETVIRVNDRNVHYEGGGFDHLNGGGKFRLISRASDTPRTWGEMTDEEKGALLLAAHKGEMIEVMHPEGVDIGFVPTLWPSWDDTFYYRIKPEPKRETVTGWWNGHNFHNTANYHDRTHRITFDTVDGKPDCGSVKMEEI